MNKIRIAIIGASEIAYRRFLPALKKDPRFEFVGVSFYREEDREKASSMQKDFGGKLFHSYEEVINSDEVDALYIPQPPALHKKYAEMALNAGKHVLLEKPFTANLDDTIALLKLAKEKNLVVHENYMFRYHKVIKKVQEIIRSGVLGEVREYRLSFGFPGRAATDFRYNKALGGGALLDCGGYPICLASILLGEDAKITYHQAGFDNVHEVDMFGHLVMENPKGETAYISYGMDNAYSCELYIWGSKGTLKHERIFTAPSGLQTEFILKIGNESSVIKVEGDDSFLSSIDVFYDNIMDVSIREKRREEIYRQAKLIDTCQKGVK